MSDNIAGGLGDNRPDADFDADQLQAGIEVEMEHTNEPDIAKEIAKDHLTEDPLYYERLALVEVSKAWSLHDAGKWLADKWSALENRYGRRAALTMAVAMLATLPLPGNIAAIVGIAEGIRGMVAKSIKKGTLYKTDASERSATFVLSTEATDRDGETVNPEGGNFDDYAKNPVVAFNHNTDDFPIGTSGTPDGKVAIWVEEVEVDGKRKPALLGKCFFSEANPKGQLAFDMVEEGTLRGCSISFLPIGQPSKNANGGNHYEQWKLLEWSICPIGSNADAVKLSKRLKSANKSVVIQHRDGQRYWSDARKDWVPSLGSPTMYRSVADASAAVIGNDLDDYVLRQWGKALGGPPPEKGFNMPRKMWVKNKTAWLKSQDGPLDPETQAHIQELGLDEVRIEDVEPVEEGWEETGREEKAPHDAFIRELMGKVSRNEINMFQAAQQLSRRMGVSIQDAQDELMSSEFGTSKRKAVEQLETMIKQEVPKLADADDEVIERCGDMMKSDGVDDNTVERAKRLVRKKLKSLSDDDETGPMGLRALRRWMKAIEEDMEEIEEKNVLGAGDKAIKLMKQAMRRAYKDIAGDEEDDEVIEDTVDKSSEPWGLQWRVPGKGGWKQRDFNTEQEREKFADKITEKEGDDVEFRWSDPAQKSVAKKLSKAKRAELKDMADFLDDAATASDTPKRLSAGMKLYAQKCKDLMGPDNEPEIKSDDDLTEEQLAELDKAFQKLADSEASLTQKMFRATGMRI